jgi:hypothetical protein
MDSATVAAMVAILISGFVLGYPLREHSPCAATLAAFGAKSLFRYRSTKRTPHAIGDEIRSKPR